jgi:hypothetical protein
MFTLDQVVPWGRSFDEYCRMFGLTDEHLRLTILGCGDGPASFNAEATRRGGRVTSCDPIYRCSADEIQRRIADTFGTIVEQTERNADQFVWTAIRSIDELARARMAAMTAFLDDFAAGRAAGRYLDAELPALPFADRSFDVALSSHFLFLYTSQLGREFHLSAVREMCRVASEVRIFPLLALDGRRSELVADIVNDVSRANLTVSIEPVAYEFQRGATEMMRITVDSPQSTDD